MIRPVILATALLALAGASSAQAPGAGVRPSEAGYLTPDQLPDAVAILGPPPAEGTGALDGDVRTYESTRGLQGSPRWTMATRDAEFGPKAMLDTFACALGVQLDRASAPTLYRLLIRIEATTEAVQQKTKAVFKRPRPFVDHPGETCTSQEQMRKSYSYPSGHSHYGFASAMVLAEIAPDRAAALLGRGRTYGESRVVCGVHYASDVQASRVAAAAEFSALQSNPAFLADVAEARREIEQARSTAPKPDPGQCAVEQAAAAQPVW